MRHHEALGHGVVAHTIDVTNRVCFRLEAIRYDAPFLSAVETKPFVHWNFGETTISVR